MVFIPSRVFELLAKGRADINIIPAIIGKYYIRELGLQDRLVELPSFIPAIPFHLVIGKKSSFTGILPKFDQVVLQMRKDGSLEAVIDRYTK